MNTISMSKGPKKNKNKKKIFKTLKNKRHQMINIKDNQSYQSTPQPNKSMPIRFNFLKKRMKIITRKIIMITLVMKILRSIRTSCSTYSRMVLTRAPKSTRLRKG